MTGNGRRQRRQYAHRAPRRREPVFAITAGVLLVALCIPVAWRVLSNDSNHRVTTRQGAKTKQTSGPRSTAAPSTTQSGNASATAQQTTTSPATTTAPTTTGAPATIPRSAPGILIRVVPAVRDVQIKVGETLYTTSSDGIVAVPDARGTVNVTYVGYSVVPALQQVGLGSWSDGSSAAERTLDANGRGHVGLAVNLRYRVTIKITGPGAASTGSLKASSAAGSLTVTDGSQHWVLAERGEVSGADVVARPITYSFAAARGSGSAQRFTATPESLWVIRAP